MAKGKTIILASQSQRDYAKRLIDDAPAFAVFNVREASRSKEQSDKMWAMCTDVSRQKPQGREMIPENWKLAFMHMLGHEMQFEQSLDGKGFFPIGYSSRALSVTQMSDLIECIYKYGAEHGIVWGDERKEAS